MDFCHLRHKSLDPQSYNLNTKALYKLPSNIFDTKLGKLN